MRYGLGFDVGVRVGVRGGVGVGWGCVGVGVGIGLIMSLLSRAWLAGSQLDPRQAKRPCSGVRSHMKQARRGCCAALSSTLAAVRSSADH